MPNDLSPAAVVRALEHGQDVVIPASNGFLLRRLLLSVVVGAALLALLTVVVASTLEQGESWVLFFVNLRIWAIVAGAVLCLVVAPWAIVRRMLRRENLLLTPDGIVEARSGAVRPDAFLPWDAIEEILFERRQRFGPRVLAYRLTETTANERGLAPTPGRTVLLRGGFRASERQLFDVLRAAHAWSGGRRR